MHYTDAEITYKIKEIFKKYNIPILYTIHDAFITNPVLSQALIKLYQNAATEILHDKTLIDTIELKIKEENIKNKEIIKILNILNNRQKKIEKENIRITS